MGVYFITFSSNMTPKGPSTLAFFASVSPSVTAPLPNRLCFFLRDHVREKQGEQLGGGAIADGETDAINASVGAVYTCVFCVRCPVRDGAAAQQLPLHFSRNHVREKAKEAVG
jgi:hypothetical protein